MRRASSCRAWAPLAMRWRELKRLQLVAPIRQAAQGGTPLLGICLGMQLLFQGSEEGGWHDGLNLLPGRITRIARCGQQGAAHGLERCGESGWRAICQLARAVLCLFCP